MEFRARGRPNRLVSNQQDQRSTAPGQRQQGRDALGLQCNARWNSEIRVQSLTAEILCLNGARTSAFRMPGLQPSPLPRCPSAPASRHFLLHSFAPASSTLPALLVSACLRHHPCLPVLLPHPWVPNRQQNLCVIASRFSPTAWVSRDPGTCSRALAPSTEPKPSMRELEDVYSRLCSHLMRRPAPDGTQSPSTSCSMRLTHTDSTVLLTGTYPCCPQICHALAASK